MIFLEPLTHLLENLGKPIPHTIFLSKSITIFYFNKIKFLSSDLISWVPSSPYMIANLQMMLRFNILVGRVKDLTESKSFQDYLYITAVQLPFPMNSMLSTKEVLEECTAWRFQFLSLPREGALSQPEHHFLRTSLKEPPTYFSSSNLSSSSISTFHCGEALVLENKSPWRNEQLQCWNLNFKGRVTVASVKNFQLLAAVDPSLKIPATEQEKVILQFGKIGKDIFTMDYCYPLSAFQAFAICLSSFDTKPACEWWNLLGLRRSRSSFTSS